MDEERDHGERPRVAVVGGGPAGLMAAEGAAAAGARVAVYDRMPSVGRKLLMAGRSGLNLTHAEPYGRFLARYGPEGPRLAPALDAFGPDALRVWCGALGIETFVGSSGRVFPTAMKASPLLRAWLARLGVAGVTLHVRHAWTGFAGPTDLVFSTETGSATARADAVVLALGGASWPRLGSDGAWAGPLGEVGVRLAPFAPANAAVRIDWSDRLRDGFAGAPLKRIALSVGAATVRGEAVVTRTGLEGGAVYGVSRTVRERSAAGLDAGLTIDLRPDLAAHDLARALGRPRGRQSASTFLRKAAKLAPVAIALLHDAAGPRLPEEPGRLAALVKAVPLAVTGLADLDRAISTAGGIALDALDDAFMLRARPGVFAAGEMLDWEAPTGGYLLQAAWATGHAAGLAAAAWARGVRDRDGVANGTEMQPP